MIIDVNQTVSKKKNQFEIIYNGEIKYVANLPFISLNGTFDLEKLRKGMKDLCTEESLTYQKRQRDELEKKIGKINCF